ncbi:MULTISPECIES: phosphatase PAP2 family protein [unclassified Brevundimonas]|uniref:phosphatase PAP2 family protein n=1 Tax=unclassified Brevundimonas TaxID=2622653 RepID=UPI001FD7CFF1|nr:MULTISPECIES: phosphatase PAP2 family protein [unclassified Brevundimonas]
MIRAAGLLLATLLGLTACAGTPAAVTEVPGLQSASNEGYVGADLLTELARSIPPPPSPGSDVDLADRAASAALRPLLGGDRWLLATAHAEVRPDLAAPHFDCALGVRMGGQQTPALERMLARLFQDADHVAEAVKARAARPRPVADDQDRQSCQRITDAGRNSPSYPSGTAAVGAAYGEAFAALDPDRSDAARRTGDEIAISRQVCAMHYPSDVEAGKAIGKAVFAAAAATPAFAQDLAAARAELAMVRATGLTNPGCAAEAATLAVPLPQP